MPLLPGFHEKFPLRRDVNEEETVARDLFRVLLDFRNLPAQALSADDINHYDCRIEEYAKKAVAAAEVTRPVQFSYGLKLQVRDARVHFVGGQGGERCHKGAEVAATDFPGGFFGIGGILRIRMRGVVFKLPPDVFRERRSDPHILQGGEELAGVAIAVEIAIVRVHRDETVTDLFEDAVSRLVDRAEKVAAEDVHGQGQNGNGSQDGLVVVEDAEGHGNGDGCGYDELSRHDGPEVPLDLCQGIFPVEADCEDKEHQQNNESGYIVHEIQGAFVEADGGITAGCIRGRRECHIVIDEG